MTATIVPDALADWSGHLGPAAVHGAAAIAGERDSAVLLAAALALWAPLHGHSCIELTTVAADVAATSGGNDAPVSPVPPTEPWRAALAASPLVRVVGRHDADVGAALDDRPLVLHGLRLYTQRQWIDECTVALALRSMAGNVVGPPPGAVPLLEGEQHAAAVQDRRLAVIVGGPGTGKTYTVGCLLAAHLSGTDRGWPPRIGLAAPTGKAAARLTEAIGGVAVALRDAGDPEGVAERLGALRAVTVHRLLGPRPDHRSRFRHHAGDPLPYDIVIVDETSMVPMPLMARLLEAIPEHCRLVLLGDPDQLESIEVGAVLADIVGAAADGGPLAGTVRRLTRQRRTAADSPIAALADAVRDHDGDRLVDLLRQDHPLVTYVPIGDDEVVPDAAVEAVIEVAGPIFSAAAEASRHGDALAALDRVDSVRVLCGHRRGPYGVETWNRRVEQAVLGRVGRDAPGRPLLATANDLRTGIVNGDTGILVSPSEGARGVRAAFRRGGSVRDFALAELEEMDTAFAMTVHKTQGSEYDTVVLVHPPAGSPLAGRELLYTAITRAKRRLIVVASEAALRRAVATPARRITGLRDALAR
jgi:exodeoxyribonuclease V alpha subunit